jgi:hypothetical protein
MCRKRRRSKCTKAPVAAGGGLCGLSEDLLSRSACPTPPPKGGAYVQRYGGRGANSSWLDGCRLRAQVSIGEMDLISQCLPIEAQHCGSNPSPAGATGGWRQLYDHLSVDRPPAGLQHALLLIPAPSLRSQNRSQGETLWEGDFLMPASLPAVGAAMRCAQMLPCPDKPPLHRCRTCRRHALA